MSGDECFLRHSWNLKQVQSLWCCARAVGHKGPGRLAQCTTSALWARDSCVESSPWCGHTASVMMDAQCRCLPLWIDRECRCMPMLTGDGSNALKVFGQPDRMETAAAAAACPSGPEGQQCSDGTSAAASPSGSSPVQEPALTSQVRNGAQQPQQQQQPAGSKPDAPWEQLCSVACAHAADLNCVRWHPSDPTLLASAGDDGVIKIWRLHPPGSQHPAATAVLPAEDQMRC